MPEKGNDLEITSDGKGNVSAMITYENPADEDATEHVFEVTNEIEEGTPIPPAGEGIADATSFFNRLWPFK